MKRFLLICLLTVQAFITSAQQQTNLTGWAIIQEGTKYKTLMVEGFSYYLAQSEGKKIDVLDFEKYKIMVGEPILVLDNFKGGVLAFDPMGRVVFIESKNTLSPITEYKTLSTGLIKESITLLDGSIYPKGRYILIVAESFDKNTYTTVVGAGQTVEIPMSKVELVKNRYTAILDYTKLETAGN
jgi:hypothetical protein